MSAGSMSLVNCMRCQLPPTASESAWASVVLPTPGKSSSNRCPPASTAVKARSTTSGLPMMMSLIMARPRASSSARGGSARAVEELLIKQCVDLGGAHELCFDQPLDGMGGEIHQAEVVAGLEVGVVAFLIGNPGHGVDEGHGFVEALEVKAAVDLCAVVIGLPAGHLRQKLLDLFIV